MKRETEQTNQTVIVPDTEPFIDKWEVCRRLSMKVRTVDAWMRSGRLVYYKMGRSVRFKWSEIEAHLASTCRIDNRDVEGRRPSV